MLGGHRVEILDDDVSDPTGRQPDANDLVGLQRMDVDLHQRLVADHQDAIRAELHHLVSDLRDRPRWLLDEELHVVPALPGGCRRRRRRLGRDGLDMTQRDLLAGETRKHALEDELQATRARIDDTRGAVGRVLQLGSRDGGTGLPDDVFEHVQDVASLARRRILHRDRESQDRPRRRSADRFVRVPSRELDRAPHLADPGMIRFRERLLHATEDLRQDHAAVAARAHERALRSGGADGW